MKRLGLRVVSLLLCIKILLIEWNESKAPCSTTEISSLLMFSLWRLVSPTNIWLWILVMGLCSRLSLIRDVIAAKASDPTLEILLNPRFRFSSFSIPTNISLSTDAIWLFPKSSLVSIGQCLSAPPGMDLMLLWWRKIPSASAGMSYTGGSSVRSQWYL